MEENTQPLELRRYLAVLLRKKYVVISVGLIVISLFTWGSFLLPRTYEASTTVSISKDSVLEPLIKGVGVTGGRENNLRDLKNAITTRNIIEKVIKKLGMDAGAENSQRRDVLIENIREKINVENMDITSRNESPNLFKVSYSGGDPKTVFNVVEAITNTYIDEQRHSRRTDTSEAYEFIQSQVLEYKKKLEESDKELREFKERNPNMIPQSETTLLTRLEGFQSSKIETDIKMKELIKRKENLQKQLSGEKELTVALVTQEGSPQARLNYLNNQLMLLMGKFTENYPEVIKVKAEIEELKRQIAQVKDSHIGGGSETATLNPIYQQLREELAKTEAEIESLRARSLELSRQQKDVQGIFGRVPKEQEEWTKIQRDRNVYQQIYDQLLQKLENARVSKEIEFTDKSDVFKIVDPARLPLFPSKPNRIKIILLGIFFGIASGIGIAFGLENFDHSYKDEGSIEASLKMPVLAMIPMMTSEADEISAKRLERKVFIASGAYLSIIFIVLLEEFLAKYMGIRIINF